MIRDFMIKCLVLNVYDGNHKYVLLTDLRGVSAVLM
jgi:hypothetical protein